VNVINVHIVDSPWPSLLANAAFGLVGAIIGAVVVWWTARASQAAAARDALDAQREERNRQRAQQEAAWNQQAQMKEAGVISSIRVPGK